MVFGFLCGLSTIQRLSTDFFGMEENIMSQTKLFFMRFFGLIVTLVAITVSLLILTQRGSDYGTSPCPNCTWLSCVPFPPWEDQNNKWWYCDDCGRVTADLITQPEVRLELSCPNGSIAYIELDQDTSINRQRLQRKLPQYCRQHCSDTEPDEL